MKARVKPLEMNKSLKLYEVRVDYSKITTSHILSKKNFNPYSIHNLFYRCLN
jgi:hypothetical protein